MDSCFRRNDNSFETMTKSPEGQEAVIRLMNELRAEIAAIEQPWAIRFTEADMRPRIEHFHDAVRALTSGSADIYARDSRLSVEHLAYDLGQLRLIQQKPVGTINRSTQPSLEGSLVEYGKSPGNTRLPDQKTRQELSALYKRYTLFFAALFAQTAEENFTVRSEESEAQKTDLAMIEQVLKQLVNGQLTPKQAEQELNHVERDDLRDALQAMTRKGKMSPADLMKATGMISTIKSGLKTQQDAAAKAHHAYATGQLAVYEDGKDLVKKLAAQGLNLAGKFVAQAAQGQGQGRGR
jgi:hypothetical protein